MDVNLETQDPVELIVLLHSIAIVEQSRSTGDALMTSEVGK